MHENSRVKSDNDLIRVSLKGKHGDPYRSDLTPLFTCLRENHLRGGSRRGIRIGIFRRDVL